MCIDIKNMYLATPMDRYEYMRMPINLIPKNIIQQYNLRENARTDMYTGTLNAACTAYHRPVSWPTNFYANALNHTDTMK